MGAGEIDRDLCGDADKRFEPKADDLPLGDLLAGEVPGE